MGELAQFSLFLTVQIETSGKDSEFLAATLHFSQAFLFFEMVKTNTIQTVQKVMHKNKFLPHLTS